MTADTRMFELSPYERAVMLGMTMQSLRGNWTQVMDRLAIIGEICDQGVGDHLSDEFLEVARSRANGQATFRRATYQYNDGRTFRGSSNGCYGKLWDEVEKDEETMRKLATYIPHDMTFDSFYFNKEFGDDD